MSSTDQNIMELAGCVIFASGGKILLLHRNTPTRTQWELPGGKIKPGEAAPAAAIREAKEELGVDVEIVKPLGSAGFSETDRSMNYTWFHTEIISGSPAPMEAIFDDLQAFSWTDLVTRSDLSSNVKNLIAAYPAGIRPGAKTPELTP
jgi:8-oxo-dGTP pyrophosphatase MutT (NUDIX family)